MSGLPATVNSPGRSIRPDSAGCFFEAELKYGCDVNFIQGLLNRYNLELAFFRSRLDGIEPKAPTSESFFTGERH